MNRNIGVLILRLAFGFQLVKTSFDYVAHPATKMLEFVGYLQSLGFPFPVTGAYISAYTEFIGGILWLMGFQTKLTSLLLIINFAVAVGMAHLNVSDSYQSTFPALNLFAVAIFLFLNGPGCYSVDERGYR